MQWDNRRFQVAIAMVCVMHLVLVTYIVADKHMPMDGRWFWLVCMPEALAVAFFVELATGHFRKKRRRRTL